MGFFVYKLSNLKKRITIIIQSYKLWLFMRYSVDWTGLSIYIYHSEESRICQGAEPSCAYLLLFFHHFSRHFNLKRPSEIWSIWSKGPALLLHFLKTITTYGRRVIEQWLQAVQLPAERPGVQSLMSAIHPCRSKAGPLHHIDQISLGLFG